MTEKKVRSFENKKFREKDGRDKPCRICERENKENRYHPESQCWFRNNNIESKKDQIRSVNNSELEMKS